MPISDLPPQGTPWRGLVRWLALITVGATAIASSPPTAWCGRWCCSRARSPRSGPTAYLPVLPERGPAEVRATARALNSLSSRLRRRWKAGCGSSPPRARPPYPDDAHAAPGRVRRGRGGARLWLKDLDELERIADSAILLVREERGKAPPELIRLDDLVAEIAAELGSRNSMSPCRLRAGQRAREPARAQAGLAQSDDQCGHAWRPRQHQGQCEGTNGGAQSSSRMKAPAFRRS